ncbi:hypothetical protein SAMN00768000_3604 [Sulfobacillus thermosulfidooxidans DSM 9293]|uniref:Uncharacterized protein n=1 Tax=Sulfobacillus thermosulfidooxidans (strain DSM 9293 / VKM B-1269 / AT-1) TaxID=929705 RepID=A0A1W1WP99_SULTA|nr:hypothetical protein [Sulfobacillus thermosulfidooxidans]SMC08032.1 hypothetical protein SAMN00768000_3604 [Sulfobacillus thermosulfidooxidans DSM 9293]
MTRCLIDGGPEWFDRDKATRLATSPELSLGVRHILYRTATGQYVIERDTRWENQSNTYTRIKPQEAAIFCLRHDALLPPDLVPFLDPHEM